MQISLSEFIAYGIICSCLCIAVFFVIQTVLVLERHFKWMEAFDKNDEEGMKKYDSGRRSLMDNWKWLVVIIGLITISCFGIFGLLVGI